MRFGTAPLAVCLRAGAATKVPRRYLLYLSHQCTRGAGRLASQRRGRPASAVVRLLLVAFWMVSVGRPRDIDYYLDEVSAEDAVRYYGQESMGVVSGELGRQLGLTGPIDRAEAEFLARLVDPATGERVNENRVDRHFFDLTASPPKSVSILWAAAEGEQRTQIESVLAEANAAALQVFEQEAAKARRGHAGAEVVDGEGLLFMTFVHTTSRADETDPQYHFHNLVLNATTGPDGRTTALDSRQLYRNRYAADAIFQATLREGLRRELGLLFTDIDDHGSFEIAGIGQNVRDEFSARRLEIVADMAERGTRSSKAARLSALATRSAKGEEHDGIALRARWAERFEQIGHANRHLPTLERANSYSLDMADIAERVTQHNAVYERRHVVATAAHLADDGATFEQVIDAVGQYFDSSFAIELAPGSFTTPEILELERATVSIVQAGVRPCAAAVEPEALESVLDSRRELSAEQRSVVETLTTSGNRVDVLVGQPGTGKGHVLGVIADAFEADGYDLVGTALAARTKKQLQTTTGIKSHTTARLLADLESGRTELTTNSVLVIDEAGIVGTRQTAALIAEVDRVGAKAILVGDPKQLPEIDAGGLFAAIAKRVEVQELTKNYRLNNPIELAAARSLRAGDADQALEHIHRAGSLVLADRRPDLVETLVADWHESHRDGAVAMMLAPTRMDAADLNDQARQVLKDAGQLGEDLVAIGDTVFAEGDVVVGHKNNYRAGLLNGDRGVVIGLAEEGLRIELDDGKHITATNNYLIDGHLSHGYAMTVHKAQGITVDNAFLLGDEALYKELSYVGLTRGRQANRFYTVVSRDELGNQRDDRLADVRFALGQSRSQEAAIDFPNQMKGM